MRSAALMALTMAWVSRLSSAYKLLTPCENVPLLRLLVDVGPVVGSPVGFLVPIGLLGML